MDHPNSTLRQGVSNQSQYTADLDERHRRELVEGSGIDPEIVAGRGYFTVSRPEEAAVLGFSEYQRKLTPALAIPMWSPSDEQVTCQIKPDRPRKGKKGKVVKYETPGGSKVRLDVHPSQNGRLRDAETPLWVVEGVKKADALASRGEVAVALQGVWCWKRDGTPLEEWEEIVLHGRVVFVAFDSDVTANPKVQAALEGLVGFLESRGATTKIVYLPDAEDGSKAGVDDFLVAGGTIEGLKALAEDELRDTGVHNLTDLGNSERFADRHGDDARYVYPWSAWLTWTGIRWEVDEGGATARMAKETVRAIYLEAADAGDSDRRKAISNHARSSESRSRIEAMIALAQSEMPIRPDELDADPWMFNCENGTVDLRTGELREHDRADLLTKLAPVEYDPNAKAPAWGAFLARILPDVETRRFVQRMAGYSLSGSIREHVLPILYGTGANGKSTFLNTLMAAMGGYGQQSAPDLLLAKRGSHPTELADLFGARLVASIEVEEGRRFNESLVKSLTGGDTIKARRLYENFWQFEPSHKVWLATNHRPDVRGTDQAIWRRIKLIPFTTAIPPEEQDTELPEKLLEELPGVLAWAVRGSLEWQRDGLGEPDAVRRATNQYRAVMDVLAGFLNERCVIGRDAWAKFGSLYADYTEWCEESGERPESKRRFGEQLAERGYPASSGSRNVAIRRGIGLKEGEKC
ncbi:MAG: phage/plasmid primase, P4 family [Actinomycetota bacterium]|nr:phage/plasmid primase, P4 family [Actinomycetota bacterium]